MDVQLAQQLPVCLTVASKALGVKLCIGMAWPKLAALLLCPKQILLF